MLPRVSRCTTNSAESGPLSILTAMRMSVPAGAKEVAAHCFRIARIGVSVCSSGWSSSGAKDTSMSSLEVGESRHGVSACSSVFSLTVASHADAAVSSRKGEAEYGQYLLQALSLTGV